MKRTASAVWQGSLKDGKGVVSSQSGVLKDSAYSFASRFEQAPQTNPEELIAAAHAGCFAMALSNILGGAGLTPDRLSVNATLTLDKVDNNWTINTVHLDLKGKVSGVDQSKFQEYANQAKAGCPVSRLLKAEITMDAALES